MVLIYNLPEGYNSRAMMAVPDESGEDHKFLVATYALDKENEMHLVKYSEDNNRVDLVQVYPFAGGEIYSLGASEERVMVGHEKGVTVLNRKYEVVGEMKSEEPILAIEGELTSNFYNVQVWDLATQQAKEIIPTAGGCKSVKKDPHNANIIAYANGREFGVYDLRSKKERKSAEMPMNVLDVDFNPIKVNTIASAGQDSTIRFWDLRKLESGLCLHSYNPTDTMVCFESDSKDFAETKFGDTRTSMSSIHSSIVQKY